MGDLVTIGDGDHLYALDRWPLSIALAGLVACLVALIVRAALRGKEPADGWARVVRWVAGSAALVGSMGFAAIVVVNVTLRHAFWPPARTVWQLFPTTMVVGCAAGAGAGIAMIGYVLVAARRVSSRGVGARATAIACTILGIAGFFAAQSGTTFSVWLDERGGLPRIVHEATPWMHAGETLVLRPRLEQGNASGWTPPPPIRLSPERPGRLRLQAAANLGPLRIERRWSIRAREALSHPSLPLQVGNRWRYQWTRTSHGALVWGLVRTRGPSSQGRFELAITESRVQRGARQFRISRFDETREPESWWLYPLEGRTFVLSGEVPAAADRALDMPWPGSDEAFSIPMIPGACRGVARGPLPGPCVCDRRGGVDVGSVVVAVFTAGLVLPQSDERTVLLLESSHAGDGVAARAAGVPVTARVHRPSPPSCDLPDDRRAWFCVVARLDEDVVPADVARRVTRAGLRAWELTGRRVAMRARRDQAARVLGSRIRGRAVETDRCPGFRCAPEIVRDRATPATLGVASLTLDLAACDGLP